MDNPYPGIRRIFVIGPMNVSDDGAPGGGPNTLRLTHAIERFVVGLHPPVEGVVVEGPDTLLPGDIAAEVFGRIDIADLVVADLSPQRVGGRQPSANVVYELALADALGLPTLLVYDGSIDIPFYFRGLHVRRVDFSDASVAEAIGPTLESMIRGTAAGDLSVNPTSRFFGAPVVNISAAVGLAVGYFNNFVEALAGAGGTFERERDGGGRDVDRLVVVVPERLANPDALIESLGRDLAEAGAGGVRIERDVVLAAGSPVQRQVHLIANVAVDVPRTLRSLRESPRIRRLRDRRVGHPLGRSRMSDQSRERIEASMLSAFRATLDDLLSYCDEDTAARVSVVGAQGAATEVSACLSTRT